MLVAPRHARTRRRNGTAQELERRRHVLEAVLGDLVCLDHDAGECPVIEGAAVEEKAHPARAARVAGGGNRHTRADRSSTTSPLSSWHLAPACLPRRLPAVLHLATGDRPPALVRRLEHEEPPGTVEDQSTRRCRDPRDLEVASASNAPARAHQARFPSRSLRSQGSDRPSADRPSWAVTKAKGWHGSWMATGKWRGMWR